MIDKLKAYKAINEQEQTDQEAMLQFIERNPDCFERTNLVGHITSSAIVMNKTLDKVLFAHHNIYNSWGWVGGHNDGDSNCLFVAMKEAKEETGVENIYPFSEDILGLDIIYVSNHIKNGKYVSDHLHLNVTYLLIADETDELKVNIQENSGVRWFHIDEVFEHVSEERMVAVYRKLFDKAQSLKLI